MAAITAADVKSLREQTGLPMMECKTALTESQGDIEEAKTLLQKKYKGKMEKRAGNETGEGRIGMAISSDRKTGAIVDLRCETAPVAKTDNFIKLADNIAAAVLAQDEATPSVDAVKAMSSPENPGKTIAEDLEAVFGLLRENIVLHASTRMSGGYTCGYVHHDGKTGVLVSLDAAPNPESIGIDLCHHVTFARPLAIDRDGVAGNEVEKIRQIAKETAEEDGKPANIVEKIVEGKVNAFYAENTLMEQEHVKVSKTKVRDVLAGGGVSAVQGYTFVRIGS